MAKTNLELLNVTGLIEQHAGHISRYDPMDLVMPQGRIDSLVAMLKGEKPEDTSVLTGLDPHFIFNHFLISLVYASHEKEVVLKEDHFVIKFLCDPAHIADHNLSNALRGYMNGRLSKKPSSDNNDFLSFLKKQGFTDEDLMDSAISSYGGMLFYWE